VLLLVAAAMLPAVCAAQPAPDRPYRVVVIQGSDPLMPAPAHRLQGMRRALAANGPGIVDVTTESLDNSRFGGPELEAAFLELMRAKYRRTPIDAIVAIGGFGLEFSLRHRAELWSDAPIVYHAFDSDRRLHPVPPRVTAIASSTDVNETLELARRLQPDARRVVIVAGTGAGDEARARRTVEAVQRLAPPLEVVRVSGTLEQLKRAVATLPRDSIVMYDGVARDASGATFFPSDVADVLASASTAPMYGHFESSLGRGIVGGALVNTAEQGRVLGEVAAAVIAGRAADAATYAAAAGNCAVDARQLERWKIPASRVPEGCAVAFRADGLLASYPWQVSGAIALILVQATLIGALLFLWRQKRRAATETQQMRSELAHAARLATVGELTAAISHEINQPLGAVQSSADAAEMLLEGPSPRLDRVREILANIRAANHRASEVVRRLRALLAKHEATRQPFDLNETVDDVVRMVDSELRRRRIAIELRSSQRPMWVEGDPVQVQQVVLNLIMNAMDAIGDAGLDRRRIRVRLATDGEGMAILQVSDRGEGIPDENLPRLFESFFTTKAHGMGLGLSVSHSIVKAHGGRIQARNNSHGGATFVVSLPLGASPTPAEPRIAA
jgi:signal transduction histidine kinase